MTGSQIFPKIDGDIFYAADVNKLAGGNVLYTGSFMTYAGSNTNPVIVGSFLVSSNDLIGSSMPSSYYLNMLLDSNGIAAPEIFISGLSGNLDALPNNNFAADAENLYGKLILGSPFNGQVSFIYGANNAGDANCRINTNAFNNFNTNQNFIVRFGMRTNNTGSCALNFYAFGIDGVKY